MILHVLVGLGKIAWLAALVMVVVSIRFNLAISLVAIHMF